MVDNNPFPGEASIENHSDQYAQIAVQGRHAEATLQKLTNVPLSEVAYYHFAVGSFCGIEGCIFARTGYTGEDGFEVFVPCSTANLEQVIAVWDKVLVAGEPLGIQPIGLGARDTLRLEARMHLYGQDMSDTVYPHEAGLFWTVDMSKSDFIGKKPLKSIKRANGADGLWP